MQSMRSSLETDFWIIHLCSFPVSTRTGWEIYVLKLERNSENPEHDQISKTREFLKSAPVRYGILWIDTTLINHTNEARKFSFLVTFLNLQKLKLTKKIFWNLETTIRHNRTYLNNYFIPLRLLENVNSKNEE